MEFFEDSVLEDYILKADIATQIETQVEEDKILHDDTEKLDQLNYTLFNDLIN